MAHPNEELVRRGYDAFASGDMAVIDELMAEDIVWHFPGNSQVSGDFKGKAAVMSWLAKQAELSGGTLRVEPHDILANDEHGVALVRVTAQRGGKSLDDQSDQVFHISGGKVTESWINPTDQTATDDFWS
jgi:ketosteroid isomerase-like protein